MKISDWSVSKTGSCLTGVALAFAIIGTGSAGAETYQQGGSTTIIQQSGGSGKSESHITRYRDGHKIITRDGNSTDITIQREGRFRSPDVAREYPGTGANRFDRRFPRLDPDDSDCFKSESSRARDAFRQRMLDRMGGRTRSW